MQDFISLIFELKKTLSLYQPSDAINTSFRIWYIQDGVQDGTRQVYNPVGAASYL